MLIPGGQNFSLKQISCTLYVHHYSDSYIRAKNNITRATDLLHNSIYTHTHIINISTLFPSVSHIFVKTVRASNSMKILAFLKVILCWQIWPVYCQFSKKSLYHRHAIFPQQCHNYPGYTIITSSSPSMGKPRNNARRNRVRILPGKKVFFPGQYVGSQVGSS